VPAAGHQRAHVERFSARTDHLFPTPELSHVSDNALPWALFLPQKASIILVGFDKKVTLCGETRLRAALLLPSGVR
jgi:hypothetical protein